jgi:hypothetical protein
MIFHIWDVIPLTKSIIFQRGRLKAPSSFGEAYGLPDFGEPKGKRRLRYSDFMLVSCDLMM